MAKAIINAGWIEDCGHIICGNGGPGAPDNSQWTIERIKCRYCDPTAGEPYPADLVRIAWSEQR